jgi:siroheme synthase-like protein
MRGRIYQTHAGAVNGFGQEFMALGPDIGRGSCHLPHGLPECGSPAEGNGARQSNVKGVSTSSSPPYYPIFIDLRAQLCLVVGGGPVAVRKVQGLLAAGAYVRVIAPQIRPMPPASEVVQRPFHPDDVTGAAFVIAATDDAATNAAVAAAARAHGIWVNVVDAPTLGTCILPAVVRRGALRIAISTGGASPVLARRLREALERAYGEEYGELVELLADLRATWDPRLTAASLPQAARRAAWEAVVDLPLLDWIRQGERTQAYTAAETVLAAASAHPPVLPPAIGD